ncbi:hypothetical protein BAE44_0020906 [Dichanthelium oligosanthes]|uniref:NHL repeat-containing protein 2 n=1 Tax=Dichanthelium oligosanthes TaxID=888268 RepID=A0A1E5UZ77_9POAL|nr:hypothetical protein BAE44_0020906 [Dichanthelium oligosanthes]
MLPGRLLSSAPAPDSSSPGALPGPGRLGGDVGSGLSASLGSHPHPRLPRRQLASATATRAAHQAASTSVSPAAVASSETSTSAVSADSYSEIVDFIKSTFGKLEGQNHCWLNAMNGIWRNLNQEGIYLVLLYQSCGKLNSNNKHSVAFERLKYLQQRFPRLNVFAVQHGIDTSSLAAQSQAVHTIVKEYISFPILMSDKDFSNMTNGACYLLFEGSKDPMLFTKWAEEPDVLLKAIEELCVLKEESSENVLSRVSWQKEEVVKEPYVGSFRNLLLYHPACVSVDEDGDRIFISDSNHHRIIVSNSNGTILDCIGSSPGFEDGEFESAKFLHPASSFYHAAEDCLYIVDSENHAVRKADLGRRTLETVYPVSNKSSGIWSWITDKLGLRKEVAPTIQDFDAVSVALPWHLIQVSEDVLLVADRSFESPWILRISTGEKQDIGRGRSTEQFREHVRQVDVLPGRCNITVYIDIPADTELAAPLAENCIWRQVRGSGAEISGSDGPETTTEKVGIAQQWYDELDNLAFSEVAEEHTTAHGGDDKPADQSYQDQRRVQFSCAVNVSPGTCELVASAALYLKLVRTISNRESQKALVKQIMECQRREEHAGVELLMGSNRDARDLVVMKPVHLRLRLECGDHPAGATNKETISSESSLKINVSLD